MEEFENQRQDEAKRPAPGGAPTAPGTETARDDWAGALAAPSAREPSRAERVRETADKAIEVLADAIEAGKSDALKNYLSVMARFHRYSFGNVLLIAAQRPDSTLVAGFRKWNEVGRHVRKQERGIGIMAPLVKKVRGESETAGEEAEGDERVLRGFRVVYVFDISQTEGEPLPQPEAVRGEPGPWLERLTKHVEGRGIELVKSPMPAGQFGLSMGGRIELAQGMSPAQEFSVLVHELAHELLHHDPAGERPDSRTVRETDAESIAFVVATSAGLEVGASSSDYIQLYNANRETLRASLARIQRVSAEILAAIEPPSAHTSEEASPPLR
ncbi:MAG TPA: ArdC family protein [Candidatus Nitrosotalea sp.]|nr:ArdC family protein [Candidatus Nitrosotalea sp.]